MIVCKGCNEEYDETMFSRCPFCLTELDNCNENKEIVIKTCDSEITIYEEEIEDKIDAVLEETVGEQYVFEAEDVAIVDIPFLGLLGKNVLHENGIFFLSQLKLFMESQELSKLKNIEKESESEIISAIILMKSHEELINIINEESDSQITSDKVEIADAFSENKYNIFILYCRTHNIKYVDDLKKFDFARLNNVQGLGKGKIDNIITCFEKVSELTKEDFTEMPQIIIDTTMFDEIDESILDLNIEGLSVLGVGSRTLHILESKGYSCLRSLNKISRKQLIDIVANRNIGRFENIQKYLKKNLVELLEIVLGNLSAEEEYKISLKRASGFTLQEIADEKGLTRERVRQIAKKFNIKISYFMDLIIKRAIAEKEYATVQELLDIYENDDYDKILISSCIQNEELEYLDFADVFVYKREDGKFTEDIIYQIATDFIGEGKDLYDNLEELETLMSDKGFPYIECGEFINLIQKYGYRMYGAYAIKGKQSYGYLCARLIAKEFPDGIKLYGGEDLDRLRALVLKEYGDLGLPDSNRVLSIRLLNYLILSGRGMVTAEENIHVEMARINDIKEYIDNMDEATIFYTELFSKFEGVLRMTSNIDNYNFLHGVLMLYYPDEYDYSKDCLYKNTNGIISGCLNERIKDFIILHNRPIHKDELKSKITGFSDAMILRSITEDKDLFQWEYNYYNCIQNISINNSIKDYLKLSLQSIMDFNNGYCSDSMLYDQTKESLSDFMTANCIISSTNLFYICAYLFDDIYDFSRPHIGKKGMLKNISTKNVALHMLGNTGEISFQEYIAIAEKFKWAKVTTSLVFNNIESDYVRVSDNRYIQKDLFKINENVIAKIENKLVEFMRFNVLPLINFNEWNELPDIGYEWNVFLLNSVIYNFGNILKIIEPRTSDRRYKRGIIVYGDTKFTEYSEVVAYVLKERGITELSESGMLSFMIINGLTYKVIPKEIYNAGCINYVNEKFIIK